MVQEKTDQEESDEKLVIPMRPILQRELALHKKTHVVILATEWGKPFTVKGFGNFMSDAIRAAGLPARCKAHGLRKAAARRLAEAGCTAKQIQAITGHKALAEVERYTRRQIRCASRAKPSTSSKRPTASLPLRRKRKLYQCATKRDFGRRKLTNLLILLN